MANIVGVDIGATGVRAVEVSGTSNALAVRRAAAVPLHKGVVAHGAVEDTDALALALKELWKIGKFSTRNVALVLGGHQKVISREANVLWSDNPDHFKGLVAAEARNALPVDLESVEFSHYVMSVVDSPTKENENRRLARVAIVGADRQLVDALVEGVEKAKLVPVSIDATPFALSRLIATASSGPNKLDVILHLGADTVILVVSVNGQPRVVQSLNEYSGHAITQQIQEVFDLKLSRAEEVKIEESRNLANGVGSRAADVVNTTVSALGGAVRNTLREACVRLNMPIGRVWVSGGGAHLGGLAGRLGAELGVQAAVLDPRTWTTKPAKLTRAIEETGQDFTLALAVGGK